MENNKVEKIFITILDVQKMLSISRATVYRYVEDGILPRSYKVKGTKVFFDFKEVLAAIENIKQNSVHA